MAKASSKAQNLDLKKGYAEKYGFHDRESFFHKPKKGLSREVVEEISWLKKEPDWMRRKRLEAYEIYESKPLPAWGNCDLINKIDFNEIYYYLKPSAKTEKKWEDVPEKIRYTFERLGIPEAERKFLAGVTAQYDSEAVYHQVDKELKKRGVIFTDMDTALREYPDIIKEHFGTIIPATDNKFAALNSAVWSGGSFVYVPKGAKVAMPLQAYFRINAAKAGQFERTLIIAEEGSEVHYIEGCTAPSLSEDALHSAVVELIARPGSHIRYTTIQNWADNVYNLVTKRAMAYEDSLVEWVDGNIGSKLTMKFPAVYLVGKGARADILSCAFAGSGQHQDTGGKLFFAAPHTSGNIVSKSVSMGGGRASYRGLVKVYPQAHDAKVNVRCDALLLDPHSRSDTYPTMEIDGKRAVVGHEASVAKIGDEQLFYLMSRGLSEADAVSMIVNGFFEAFTKELPLEYSVEMNRLIQLEMEDSVG